MNHLVSLIITTYKGANSLSRAIESALNQTHKNIEIIVVDDNEPLTHERIETEKLMLNFTKKYKNIFYIKHEQNKNGAAARNTGISFSNGKYICFLDDDDFMFPQRVERCLEFLTNNPSFAGVYCNVILTNNGKITGKIIANCELTIKDILLNEMAIGTGSNIFIKSNVVKEIKGFDEKFLRHQDLEFMLRVLEKYRIANLNESLIVKATNGVYNVPNYYKYKITKQIFIEKFMKNIDSLSEKEKKYFYNHHFTQLFHSALKTKDSKAINEAISQVKKIRPLNKTEKILLFFTKIKFYDSKIYRLLLISYSKMIINFKRRKVWLSESERNFIESFLQKRKW